MEEAGTEKKDLDNLDSNSEDSRTLSWSWMRTSSLRTLSWSRLTAVAIMTYKNVFKIFGFFSRD
jgi:hypothetical protein